MVLVSIFFLFLEVEKYGRPKTYEEVANFKKMI